MLFSIEIIYQIFVAHQLTDVLVELHRSCTMVCGGILQWLNWWLEILPFHSRDIHGPNVALFEIQMTPENIKKKTLVRIFICII
jgi:hypothetical protein